MIEMTGTRTVYANAWMTVREDTIRYPDGRAGIYSYVEKRDFALVIPRAAEGYWLVEEDRYPVRGRRLGFPQGSWPPGRSGDGEALAAAELAEETGIRASRLDFLGRLEVAHGMTDQGILVYLATGLTHGPPSREPSEMDMTSRYILDRELANLIRGGGLADAASLAAYSLYQNHASNAEAPRLER